MKSLLLTISKRAAVLTTLAFLVIAPLQPLVAQADTPDPNNPTAYYGTLNPDGTASPASQGFGNQTATGAGATNQQNQSDTSGCGIFSGAGIALCITNVVYVFTVGIGSGFAYVSAYFFDWAVALSLNGNAYALGFVSQGWTTARDLANMAFLFILLYIAFKIMFQAETNDTVHMLSLVIVVALLVNFSFFFTRLAIDAGNILAIQFYNAIDVPSVAATAGGNGVQATVASVSNAAGSSFSNSKDLTAGIMGMLNIQGLFNSDSFKTFTASQTGGAGFLVTLITTSFLYIAAGIMLWLLTVAFVTNGVKFLFRIVVLWFLIIASPLAFVARAVPKFEEYYKKWQDELIKHAFYPVVFMFIFLILTNFAKQMGVQNGLIDGIFSSIPPGASGVAAIGYAVANVSIRMGFVIAMLYIGFEASKRIGVMGADMANHAGEWVGNNLLLRSYNVGYKRVGPGALAGAIDRGLQRSRFGNTGLGYELRRYVTKPLSSTTVPRSGGESNLQMAERQRKEGAEKAAGHRDAVNQILMSELANGKWSTGQTLSASERKEREEKVKNFGKREIESTNSADLEKLAYTLKESQMKIIKDSEKFSDSAKEKINKMWNENSTDAPLKKANKQIDLLRKINENLQRSSITVAAMDTHIGTPTVKATNTVINSDAVSAMLKDVNSKIADTRSDIKKAPPGASTVTLQQNLHNLQDAVKKLEKLDEERKNIPAGIGGREDAGAFDTTAIKT